MRRSFLVLCIAAAFAVGACTSDQSASQTPGGAESPGAPRNMRVTLYAAF